MYEYVFKAPLSEMLRILINPIMNVAVLFLLYLLLDIFYFSNSNILSLIVKVILGGGVTLVFIQITHRYNIIQLIKEIKLKL